MISALNHLLQLNGNRKRQKTKVKSRRNGKDKRIKPPIWGVGG